jgi:crossover junction endodeoxyribonuclease RusA
MSDRTWTIPLPMRTPLSLNAREHWRLKARRVAQVRSDAELVTRALKIPALERVAIELHYCPRDRRRRDPLNLVATLKPVEDGIVDAGVIPDDTPEWSVPTMPIIDHHVPGPDVLRLYVVLREVT